MSGVIYFPECCLQPACQVCREVRGAALPGIIRMATGDPFRRWLRRYAHEHALDLEDLEDSPEPSGGPQ